MTNTTAPKDPAAGKCPFSSYDHHTASLAESYKVFEQMHAQCPVARSEAHGGFYVLTGLRDVRTASLDWKTNSSAGGVLLPKMAEGIVALETDAPEHTQWRALFQKAFIPSVLSAYRPKIEEIANQLIDRFIDQGSCDLVTDYAELLPIIAFFGLIGLDRDPKEILKLGSDLTSAMTDPVRYTEVFGRMVPMALEELYKRRKNPGDDFLSVCAAMEYNGALISDQEFVKLLAGLVTAGHESTATGISALLFHVLSRPELRANIPNDSKLEAAAIEETLRLNSPFLSFFRRSTKPQTIQGVEIPAGSPVMLSYAGANRDPSEFEDPAEFRLDRSKNAHLAFGFGPHTCAGAPLARMEMRIALATILRRLPEIQLSTDELSCTVYGGVFIKALSLPARFPVA